MKIRSVRWIERYRAPRLPLPGADANSGPDPLRQGANFAERVATGLVPVPSTAMASLMVSRNSAPFSCGSLSALQGHLSQKIRFSRSMLVRRWNRSISMKVFHGTSGRTSAMRVLRRIAFAVTNTPQLGFLF
ncbi:MAG TPA: hypothetical protein PKD64_19460 [Pirellulaceae bacterium]|nr:hypothetical protein [Pirellulaceae bacterium]HMO94370.1 hypothetical protein [Pirellulaceae bacterium]HMP71446.1 hypothetical protein [Pirellulaceae bacterium]